MRHLILQPLEGYEIRPKEDVLLHDVKGGLSKVRADIVGSPATTTLEFQLDPADYGRWSIFYEVLINNGVDKFTIDLMVNEWDLKTRVVQIIGKPTVSMSGYTTYVSFDIEIEQLVDNDRIEYAELIYEYGSLAIFHDMTIDLEDLNNNHFEDD